MFLTSSNSDVRQFHGAVLVWHKRYAGFLKFVIIKSPRKLIVIFFLSQFSLEDNEYMFIFVFFPKSDDRHKLVLPTRYNIAWRFSVYHWKERQNDVTARFVDHCDGGIQLSKQNNIKLQRLSLIVT